VLLCAQGRLFLSTLLSNSLFSFFSAVLAACHFRPFLLLWQENIVASLPQSATTSHEDLVRHGSPRRAPPPHGRTLLSFSKRVPRAAVHARGSISPLAARSLFSGPASIRARLFSLSRREPLLFSDRRVRQNALYSLTTPFLPPFCPRLNELPLFRTRENIYVRRDRNTSSLSLSGGDVFSPFRRRVSSRIFTRLATDFPRIIEDDPLPTLLDFPKIASFLCAVSNLLLFFLLRSSLPVSF